MIYIGAGHWILEDSGGFWSETNGFRWIGRPVVAQTVPKLWEIIWKRLGID